jgi:hypothetical protein
MLSAISMPEKSPEQNLSGFASMILSMKDAFPGRRQKKSLPAL